MAKRTGKISEPPPQEEAPPESAEEPTEAAPDGDAQEPEEAAPDGDAQEPDEAAPESSARDGQGEGEVDEQSIEDTHTYLKGLLEAILFVSDRPLSLKELARAARIDRKRAEELVEELRAESADRGIRIETVAEGLAFRSNPIFSSYVRNFLAQRPVRLSRAQLETLAIVAYRQPITRPEIDDIRGVDCGPVLKGLLERELIRILGKKDEPGRPILYGTTPSFLELFSMHSLGDLPTLKEFTELSDESRQKFETETGEEAPEGPLEVPEQGEPGGGEIAGSEVVAGEAAEGEVAEDEAAAGEGEGAPGEAEDDEDEDEDEDDEDEDDEDEDDEDDDD